MRRNFGEEIGPRKREKKKIKGKKPSNAENTFFHLFTLFSPSMNGVRTCMVVNIFLWAGEIYTTGWHTIRVSPTLSSAQRAAVNLPPSFATFSDVRPRTLRCSCGEGERGEGGSSTKWKRGCGILEPNNRRGKKREREKSLGLACPGRSIKERGGFEVRTSPGRSFQEIGSSFKREQAQGEKFSGKEKREAFVEARTDKPTKIRKEKKKR